MTTPEYVWWLLVPAAVVWAATVVDIVRSRRLAPSARALWVLAVTLVFPAALVWFLTRPARPVTAVDLDRPDPPDPRHRLACLVVARSRGRLDAATYRAELSEVLTVPERSAGADR